MRRSNRAFTLVEILIVVILLGILAAIAVPQYWNVTTEARTSNLRENLSKIRAQIQVYRNQHAGYPSGASFQDQMTVYTGFQGETSAVRDAAHPFGRYLEQMPANPVTGTNAIRVESNVNVVFAPPATGGGWWYHEVTGEFRVDLPDALVDQGGVPFNRF